MGHIIKAPKLQLPVQPAIIDDTKTRLNIDIHAATAHIAGQWVSRSYNNFEIKSLYGIYDRITDEKDNPYFTRYCIVATTTIVD
jgi:hypothetical protein